MKSRGIKIKLVCCLMAVLLAVFTVGYTFAWFANYASIEISLYTNEEGGYFAGGSGTEDDPYTLTSYKHLYNLAWLQNMGRFDGTTTYFEVYDDIDMLVNGAYCVIPPIGNDSHPFNGVFNGGGYTISHLVVSTDKDKLSNTDNAKEDSYSFSKYVGLFGNTGSSSNIYNFILDNPIVEVASTNTLYSTNSESCVGLAIGYVAGSASSIGVIGGTLAVKATGYTTYNSILGAYDKQNVTSSVTGGETGDVGTGILSPKIFINAVSTVGYEFGSYSDGTFTFYENVWLVSADSASGLVTNDYFGMGVFSILTSGTSNSKLYIKNDGEKNDITFTSKGTTTDSYTVKFLNTYSSGTSSSTIFTEQYDYSFDDSSTTTQTGVTAEDFNDKVNDGSAYNLDTQYYWLFNGSYNSDKSGIKVVGEDNGALTEGNKVIDTFNYSDNSSKNLYKQTIRFNVVDVSGNPYIYIVASNNRNGDPSGICITKTGEVPTTSDGNFYFRRDYSLVDDEAKPKEDYNYQITLPVPASKSVTEYVGVAIPITETGIYTISPASSANFNLYYLAVDGVQNGNDGGSGTASKTIENVDFIYSGVTIVDGDFVLKTDTSTAYTETGTMIYLSTSASVSTTAVLIIAYTRSIDDDDNDGYYSDTNYTLYVTYYSAGTDVPGQSKTKADIEADGDLVSLEIPPSVLG